MRLDILRSQEEFEALSGEWNALLQNSASHVPFLRHEYLLTWWRNLGGGEWKSGELVIGTGRGEDNRLRAIAPLFFTTNRDGEPALMLLGSIEISDYLDVICPSDDLSQFLGALLPRLAADDMPDWKVVDLYNLLDSSPTLPALKSTVEGLGWSYAEEKLQHCPYIPLPGDWETYLASIDKKQRHEIRRKMRRVEGADQPARWYIAQDESKLDAEIDDFFRLMEQDDEKKAFLTGAMRAQMREAIWAAFRGSWLQMAFIEIGGEKAAGYLNFDYDDHIWVYNSGINLDYGVYSPGWVLLGYLIQWANENGRRAFDFMRGGEDYKYRFGAVDRFVVRATAQR